MPSSDLTRGTCWRGVAPLSDLRGRGADILKRHACGISCSHNNRECIIHHKMLALVAGAEISVLMLAPDTALARGGFGGRIQLHKYGGSCVHQEWP
jgi:hypothetical protein